MKKKFYLLVLLFFSVLTPLRAEILEIHKLEEVLPFVDKDTLVVLDIDDTLMVPAQMLGGDCWFRHTMKQLLTEGLSFEEALAYVLPQYTLQQHKLEVKAVEDNTATVVHELQRKAGEVIALTTRSNILIYRTIEQLKSLDIDFTRKPLYDEKTHLATDFELYYIEGILSTEVRHKGEALMKVCERFNYMPKKVLFVNDKLKYVLQLDETFEELGIPYYGFRYAGADVLTSQYDPQIAKVQEKYFNKIISNEDATLILNAQNNRYHD